MAEYTWETIIKTITRNPAGIHLFKVNNRNTRIMCEVYSKLSVALVSLLLILNIFYSLFYCFFVNLEHIVAGWERFRACCPLKGHTSLTKPETFN